MLNKCKEKFSAAGWDFSEAQLEQFVQYYDMLIEKNKVMNLTAITDPDEVIVKHFIDSLSLGKYYDLSGELSLIDVGTGAGFPGIPLKIAYPRLKVTLLDSLNKRLVFLSDVVEKLGLEDVTIVHHRAEDGGRDPMLREQFDFAVARAVARLSVLAEYDLPYVKQGGFFVSYKGGSVADELAEAKKAIHLLGGTLEREDHFLLDSSDMERTLIGIRKTGRTPKAYPRKAGTPAKQPL